MTYREDFSKNKLKSILELIARRLATIRDKHKKGVFPEEQAEVRRLRSAIQIFLSFRVYEKSCLYLGQDVSFLDMTETHMDLYWFLYF